MNLPPEAAKNISSIGALVACDDAEGAIGESRVTELPVAEAPRSADRMLDQSLLTELSRANNDVITMQRDLAKKNAALTRSNEALRQARAALEVKQVALEEANRRLDALAMVDGLTGIRNRRAFDEKLEEEVLRSRRHGAPLSLVMLDVDHFKRYNDAFGHLGGDEVLRALAQLLVEGGRVTDFVARYGGEEFALVLPNTDAEGAAVVAERLRAKVEAASWPHRPVTASFGTATLTAAIDSGAAMIDAADHALYASKEKGRNAVTHASGRAPESA